MIRETQRLVLREFRDSDLDDLYEMFRDPEYQHYEGDPLTRAEAEEKLKYYMAGQNEEPRLKYHLAITIRPDERAIGVVKLSENFANIQEWEMGWGLHRSYWGKGYAPEAANSMLCLAFDELKVNRVIAICHAGNRPSVRVMEKLGMQREAHIRETRWLNGVKYDEFVYAILRSEFIER